MVDRYTKWVLTVIAGALVTIAVQGVVRPSKADANGNRVAICDYSGGPCASVIYEGTNENGVGKYAILTTSSYPRF